MKCLVVDDEALSRTFMEHFIAKHGGLELVGSCESAREAADVLKREPVDLLFLDIEMPEMNGLELVRSLERCPQIILVTARKEYALEAFEVAVTDYLLKPVRYTRFLQAVERAERQIRLARQASGHVFIRTEGRYVKLDLATVQWIEAEGDYVLMHTDTGRHLVHSTMKAMAERLPDDAFVRVHRSYIVRLDRVGDVAATSLTIEGKVIPIGASYKEDLHRRLRTL